ncbi:MAG TPA: ATP-binding cassette domain-containing protein [Spirochaetota bacterium]|nr:ATP-binding cassette domain-containing protein [Spirochaetota bacterium]HPJ35376.1 ATP-binding cassette domain-containing protein [Spirochaetota bacterium]
MNETILELRNVTYRRETITLLDDVSFSLTRGDNVTIFGPEGSGISSLFDIIIRGNAKFDGDVFYKGSSIKSLDYFGLMNHKREVGYLHGDYGLMSNLSVEQNISLPLDYHSAMSASEIKKHVDKIIYEVNLDHCKKLRPFDLTRSEILKTAFGRAIANDPDLLYIEHAFEDQCYLNIRSLIDVLTERSIRPDKSLIMITYYPQNFIDISDEFIMFFNGRIVFRGKKDDYMASDNPYVVQYRTNSIEGPMVIL